ncbi:twin-arginine translocase subunit TatC [Hyphomicrobium sp. B1]|uniref:twin-arginine translocase subunit TatC n=1 Tax=unclassified Hyphomicrobium TaxID=2619925 RepID=UPI000213E411|nr:MULTISPECIES: twin-arginine translocase subunit TatC [unclassified Hyphomicrobium]CCB65903.1 Sec-independent protein translocase protein [Hyphomicrobium sp. MC1]
MQERLPTSGSETEALRDGQDEIDASKAPLLDHLIELRQRLIYALGAFVVMFFICFSVAGHIYNVLVWPYMWASGNDHVKLIATHFLEQIMTQVKLAMFGAAFLSFPVIATQVYKFVAPGLYKNERRAFLPYLIATPVLFLLGAMMVYFVAMPVIIKFSIGLTHTSGPGTPEIELLPKVSEYLSLIMTLIFGFGLVFQLPVVLTLLARTGIVTSQALAAGRRYAIVGIFAAAALLTPPDALSMCIMAFPTIGLYEASILAVRFVERQQAKAKSDA